MMATAARTYRLGEFHRFSGGGRDFLYLVPAGAIFEMDGAVAAAIGALSNAACSHEELAARIAECGVSREDACETVEELYQSRVIVTSDAVREPLETPPADFPLQSLVMNLTNQCNLS